MNEDIKAFIETELIKTPPSRLKRSIMADLQADALARIQIKRQLVLSFAMGGFSIGLIVLFLSMAPSLPIFTYRGSLALSLASFFLILFIFREFYTAIQLRRKYASLV